MSNAEVSSSFLPRQAARMMQRITFAFVFLVVSNKEHLVRRERFANLGGERVF